MGQAGRQAGRQAAEGNEQGQAGRQQRAACMGQAGKQAVEGNEQGQERACRQQGAASMGQEAGSGGQRAWGRQTGSSRQVASGWCGGQRMDSRGSRRGDGVAQQPRGPRCAVQRSAPPAAAHQPAVVCSCNHIAAQVVDARQVLDGQLRGVERPEVIGLGPLGAVVCNTGGGGTGKRVRGGGRGAQEKSLSHW